MSRKTKGAAPEGAAPHFWQLPAPAAGVHEAPSAQAALAIAKADHRDSETNERKNKKGLKDLKELSP